MFRDLKEYQKVQDIQNIYQTSIYPSDRDKQYVKYLEELDFSGEEIDDLLEYLENNIEDVTNQFTKELREELQTLSEEVISEEDIVEYVGAALKVGGAFLKGAKAAKGAKGLAGFARLGAGFRKAAPVATKIGKEGSKSVSLVRKNLGKLKDGIGNLLKTGASKGKEAAKVATGKGKEAAKAVMSNPIVKGVGNVVKATAPLAAAGGIGGFIGAKIAGGGNKKNQSTNTTTTTTPESKGGSQTGSASSAGAAAGAAGSKGGTSFANAIKLNTPEKKVSTTTSTTTSTTASSGDKKMGAIEKKNRERFGNKRVDFLKQKQKDFKSMDRAKFREKYPNSQSAKDAKRNKSPMDMKNESLQIANELASVYQKMYQTPSEESLTEDVKNYNALVELIIKENIVSTVEEADAIIAELDNELIESYLTEGVITEGLMDAVNRVKQGVGNVVKKVGAAAGGAVDKAKQVASNVKTAVGNEINKRKEQVSDVKSGGVDKLKQGNELRQKTQAQTADVAKKTEMSKSGDVSAQSGMGNDPGAARAKLQFLKNKRQQMNNPNQKQLSGADRAKAMAKARLAAKNESVEKDAYTVVLEYLLSSQQAATIEEANYIMTELDAETIQGIISES
tara:strand:+ start:2019 stop:3878 length:1860 start_codon:yes stop_codon:yes gene_type:complete